MKTINKYIRPEVEVIELELEGTMAQSGPNGGSSLDLGNAGDVDGGANAKRRSLWGDE